MPGGHAWGVGVCGRGGMHGSGIVCTARGACVAGDMPGGVCMAVGGCVWQWGHV